MITIFLYECLTMCIKKEFFIYRISKKFKNIPLKKNIYSLCQALCLNVFGKFQVKWTYNSLEQCTFVLVHEWELVFYF